MIQAFSSLSSDFWRCDDKNADEWRTKLLKIPDGLPLGNWSSAVATIETGVIGLSASHYKFYYQDIENVIAYASCSGILLSRTILSMLQYVPLMRTNVGFIRKCIRPTGGGRPRINCQMGQRLHAVTHSS